MIEIPTKVDRASFSEMNTFMQLWVGLGNPGKKYENTRHNAGAIVLSNILKTVAGTDNSGTEKAAFKSLVNQFQSGGEKWVFLWPQTFMNLSGDAVLPTIQYHKIEISNIVVFHDEIELPPGEIRYKHGGGHKGHNGLRDIIKKIGKADFHRIRIGVGRPEDPRFSVADYVLSKLPQEDYPDLLEVEKLTRKHNLLWP